MVSPRDTMLSYGYARRMQRAGTTGELTQNSQLYGDGVRPLQSLVLSRARVASLVVVVGRRERQHAVGIVQPARPGVRGRRLGRRVRDRDAVERRQFDVVAQPRQRRRRLRGGRATRQIQRYQLVGYLHHRPVPITDDLQLLGRH